MRTWENFIKTELKKYTSYSKDDIISLFTITELKEFSRRIIIGRSSMWKATSSISTVVPATVSR